MVCLVRHQRGITSALANRAKDLQQLRVIVLFVIVSMSMLMSRQPLLLHVKGFPITSKTFRRIFNTRQVHDSDSSKLVGGCLRATSTINSLHDGKASLYDVSKAFKGCLPCVVVGRDRQSRSFRDGSPLVFSGAVAYTVGSMKYDSGIPQGALVAVAVAPKGSSKTKAPKGKRSNKGFAVEHVSTSALDLDKRNVIGSQMIGFGTYNPESMYRVRILLHETSDPTMFKSVQQIFSSEDPDCEATAMKAILKSNIRDAIQTRLALGLPRDDTNTFRLINGEGDSLSGLAVDILGSKLAVVMSSAAWCEYNKDLILQVLSDELAVMFRDNIELVWRTTSSRLVQDGYDKHATSFDDAVHDDKRFITATESNVNYKVYPWSGQKTGFYCDQRDNRQTIARLCRGKRVLDLCCYNGGFVLNAAKGGALSCVGVDSSQDAVDAAIENAAMNGFTGDHISFVRNDITDFMKTAYADGERFDVIILDPPKLAPNRSGLNQASRKYHALNRDAMKLIDEEKGGLLMTCTCSGAMTQKDGGLFFLQTVKSASLASKRQISLLSKAGAASCHTQNPAASPAGMYLTAALFHVSPLYKKG